MKQKGSTADFINHRNETIKRHFRNVLGSTPPFTSLDEIYRIVAEHEAPRFWVSDTRAAIVISAMEKADRLAEVDRKRAKIGIGSIGNRSRKSEAILQNIALGTHAVVSGPGPEDLEEHESSAPGHAGSEKVLSNMYAERREMYREIYRRYKNLRVNDSRRPIVQLMADIIYNPAPRHYISPHGIKKIIIEGKR